MPEFKRGCHTRTISISFDKRIVAFKPNSTSVNLAKRKKA